LVGCGGGGVVGCAGVGGGGVWGVVVVGGGGGLCGGKHIINPECSKRVYSSLGLGLGVKG